MSGEQGKWEQRWHPLWREWVIYSAHRNQRPWSGASVPPSSSAPAYDPECYLCPGNARIHGHRNPDYKDIFIFDNDHPVVGPDAPDIPIDQRELHSGLYRRERANGIARVVCFDPRHNVTLAQLSLGQMTKVVQAWSAQTRELYEHPDIRYVLIFENKGEIVGVSNPHPHCQIYAANCVFTIVERELESAALYKKETGNNLFASIIKAEQEDGIRVLAENENAIAFIPFFARYAYETHIFPKRRHATMRTLTVAEERDLADVYLQVIRRFDLLYGMSFPYVMSILQAPVDGGEYPDYHFHLFFQPPLRRPGLKKFPAGPEIGGGNFMADTIPEEKAWELKQVDLAAFQEMD